MPIRFKRDDTRGDVNAIPIIIIMIIAYFILS
jgi:hypothetical protein